MNIDLPVTIVGAGPYGLAASAHLRQAGVETHILGRDMSFWEEYMPRGLLLRSPWSACHIGYEQGDLTLSAYQATRADPIPTPVPVQTFVEYGRWFQRQAAPDLDRRNVSLIERAPDGFHLHLDDGEVLRSHRVIVAAGISSFSRRPPQFDGISPALASHSAEHTDFSPFGGQNVVVIGGGQSALESAALLHEAGATVEVLVRRPVVHWLRGDRIRPYLGALKPLLYTTSDVGPPGLNHLTAAPDVFRRFPRPVQDRMAQRSIRPAGASWLVPRLQDVDITTGVAVRAVTARDQWLALDLDDGTQRRVQHAVLATGFKVSLSRYGFLSPDLVQGIRQVDGSPRLAAGFECSVPRLHFLGAPAAWSFGPLMRFVSGTWFAGQALTRAVLSQREYQVV